MFCGIPNMSDVRARIEVTSFTHEMLRTDSEEVRLSIGKSRFLIWDQMTSMESQVMSAIHPPSLSPRITTPQAQRDMLPAIPHLIFTPKKMAVYAHFQTP